MLTSHAVPHSVCSAHHSPSSCLSSTLQHFMHASYCLWTRPQTHVVVFLRILHNLGKIRFAAYAFILSLSRSIVRIPSLSTTCDARCFRQTKTTEIANGEKLDRTLIAKNLPCASSDQEHQFPAHDRKQNRVLFLFDNLFPLPAFRQEVCVYCS